MSATDHSVSPYLLRPCRSLEQARRDLTDKAARGIRAGPRAVAPAEPAGKPAHDAPADR